MAAICSARVAAVGAQGGLCSVGRRVSNAAGMKMSSMAGQPLLRKGHSMMPAVRRAAMAATVGESRWWSWFSGKAASPPVAQASVVEELFSVQGKTALVTGAASGIGRQLSLFLAEVGANVVVSDKDVDKLPGLAEEIAKLGKGKAHVTNLDVLWTEDKVDAAVGEAWNAFGRVDILINNAGVFDKAPSVLDATVEQFDHQYDTNIKGLWLTARAVAKRQVADGKGGSIINNSAFAAVAPIGGHGLYSGTKAAVNNLTVHLARDLGKYNIRVNAISPGVFPTNMTASLLSPAALENLVKVPAGRIGRTEKDLNGVVLLLASEAGAFITGAIIDIDGGFHIR